MNVQTDPARASFTIDDSEALSLRLSRRPVSSPRRMFRPIDRPGTITTSWGTRLTSRDPASTEPRKVDGTTVGLDHSGEQVDKCRLARAVQPDDGMDGRFFNVEIQVLQCDDPWIGFRDITKCDQRRATTSHSDDLEPDPLDELSSALRD